MSRRRVSVGLVGAVVAVLAGACATSPPAPTRVWRAAPAEPWRQARPAPAAAVTSPLSSWQRFELKNGLTVLLLEEHTLPIVSVSLAVRAGAALDGRDPGLAALTWSLLDQGMGELSAVDVANAFGDLGAEADVAVDAEWGAVSVRVERGDLDKSVSLVSQMVRAPSFHAADVERARQRQVAAVVAAAGDPADVARRTLFAELYGAEHAYGHPADGTASSLEKIKPSSVKRFWSEVAVPKNAALILVGDLTVDDARALADKHLGKWRGGAPKVIKPAAPPTPTPRTKPRLVVVDRPDSPQTSIRFGKVMLSGLDPEFPTLTAVNLALAGLSSSRLNVSLRDARGWTPGIESTLEPRGAPGTLVIAAEVQTDAAADAVAEILTQLATMRRDGIRADELALVRAHVARSQAVLRAASSSSSSRAAAAFALGVGPQREEELAAAIDALTIDAVQATCERSLVVEEFVIVLVGDRDAIVAGLERTGLGDLVVAAAPSAGK